MTSARAVIIGSGIAGSSIAYHLTTRHGWKDIMVLERGGAIHGTTSHAPGLIGQLRGSVGLTRMLMRSVALYRTLALDGVDGYMEVGSLRLASSAPRMLELRKQAGFAKAVGLEVELMGPDEVLQNCPILDDRDLRGALYIPDDGAARAKVLAGALMRDACAAGATLRTQTEVTGVEVVNGRVRAVLTNHGRIETDTLIVAAGIWTPDIGRMVGVAIPLVPMQHQYVATGACPGVSPSIAMPNVRDPDKLVYFRQDEDALIVGGYERNPAAWSGPAPTAGADPTRLGFDQPRFDPLWAAMVERVPDLANVEITQRTNGLESFTPDGEFLLGEAPAVGGFWVAAGFNAHGMSGGGGVGEVMADWIATGDPGQDVWHMDIGRFGGHGASRRYVLDRVNEIYSAYYDISYPGHERQSARGLRTGPIYERLRDQGAVFGEKAGWERPNWFTSNLGKASHPVVPRGWPARHWSPAIAAEHQACRERAALFDESSFAKIEVVGDGAMAFLQRMATNDMDKPVGTITYTQLCDQNGGIQADLTVTRLAADRFFMVTGTAFGPHDLGWLRRHAPADVQVLEVTSGWACLGLWGPRARDILAAATDDDVSNAAFPYMTAQAISVGAIPVRAMRVTYVGELGWELYAPTEYARALWEALWAAGQPHGVAAAGYKAIDSLRLEKGYRAWGTDITPDDTPFEAGLGFAVRLAKGGFMGFEALQAQKANGVKKKMVALLLDDDAAWVVGGEPILGLDGQVVGRVTSGGFGHTIRRSIAYGYVPADLAVAESRLIVAWFGEKVGATVAKEPLFDPKNEKIKS